MIKITEVAAEKVKEVLKNQNKKNAFLRVYLVGAGWGGPNFGMTLEESKTNDDILDEEYGVSLITDKKLTTQLEGATIDFVQSVNGEGFEIRMANSGSGGGCGDSCGGSC